MKPSSTDSLSTSSPSASVGRNTWSWVRAGPAAATDTAGRWPQLGRQGFPTTNRGSPLGNELRWWITEGRRSPCAISAVRTGLCCEWRLAGLGLELGWMAWEKWMKVGWWFCCWWGWLTLDGWQLLQGSKADDLENGVGGGGRFCKTLGRQLLGRPSDGTVSFGVRRDGSLRLRMKNKKQ